MKKILMLSWKDMHHPLKGGAEVITDAYLSELAKKNDVTLFCAGNGSQKFHGYEIIRKGNRLTVYLHAIKYLMQNKEKFDIIIDQINTIPFFTPLFVSKKKRITFIHQLAKEYWFTELNPLIGWIGYLLEPVYLRLYTSEQTITVSESTKKDLVQLGFSHVSVVPNFYDGPFASSPKKKQFCFVARLVNAKGVKDAIDSYLQANLNGYELVICGDGPLKPYVQSMAKKHPSIKYKGYVSLESKRKIMAESLALLFPSVREGFGLTVLEAAACGTPTIGYPVAGLVDTIGPNGTLTRDLTKAMIQYTKSRPSVAVCHKWAKEFKKEESVQNFLSKVIKK